MATAEVGNREDRDPDQRSEAHHADGRREREREKEPH